MISFSSYILCYSFIVTTLILNNNNFVYPFRVPYNRYLSISRLSQQFISIPRNLMTKIYSDPEDFSSSEEPEASIFRDDLDDEIAVIEEGDEEIDEEEIEVDDNESTAAAENTIPLSWKERRVSLNAERARKAAQARARLSWEEQYEDDPLRSDSPTKALEETIEPFEKFFVIIGDISDKKMLSIRGNTWIHHMQWARRSALLPDIPAKVKWEYTRLSPDGMGPVNQVIGIKANTSSEVRELLESEPLSVAGGVSPWKLFEFIQFNHENTTWDLSDPKLFIGYDSDSKASKSSISSSGSNSKYEALSEDHHDYHMRGGRPFSIDPIKTKNMGEAVLMLHPVINHKRAVLMGRLVSCDKNSPNATLVLFNAKTNADALRYMNEDPLVKEKNVHDIKKSFVSACNVQDVDGLHHMMAKTFGEKTVLDQFHYEDPEDLLDREVSEIIGLPNHAADNLNALKMLDALDISYRYTRLSMTERYGGLVEAEEFAQNWNKRLEGPQKVRMSPTVGADSDREDSLVIATSDDDSSSTSTDIGSD